MELLKGMVVMVTGAAAGIGAGVDRLFAQHGAHLFFIELDQAQVNSVAGQIQADGGSAFGFGADARDREAGTACTALRRNLDRGRMPSL